MAFFRRTSGVSASASEGDAVARVCEEGDAADNLSFPKQADMDWKKVVQLLDELKLREYLAAGNGFFCRLKEQIAAPL